MSRFLLLCALLLILAGSFLAPAYSQTNSSPQISVVHQFRVNSYGFAILNESVTFTNNGTTPIQIPTIHLGIPDSIVSRAAGFLNQTGGRFTLSSQAGNGSSFFAISPIQATLQPKDEAQVTLKTYLKDLVSHNITSSGPSTNILVMLSPSTDIPVTLVSMIQLPTTTSLKPSPSGFSSGNNNSIPFYQKTQKDFRASSPGLETFQIQVGDPNSFQPVEVLRVTRTLTASSLGLPIVSDQITVRNVGDLQINRLKLSLLPGVVTTATVMPSYHPPIINPTIITVANGILDLTKSPFKQSILAGDNFTVTLAYDLPAKDATVSGNKATVNLPYSPPIDGVIDAYTITASLPPGLSSTLSTTVKLNNASPLLRGTATFEYTIGIGWAAEQAIPVSSLLFAIVFVALYARRGRPLQEEEEVETVGGSLTDAIKAFEEKIAAVGKAIEDITSKPSGSLGKKNFDEIRNRLDAARGKAIQRLTEAKTRTGSRRLLDLANQINEAERVENRASKDLVNLYEQYYTRRMRQDTFEKLLPSYKRRLDEATNHLSDSLNAAQKENKPA